MAREGGNPDIKDHAHKGGPKTKIGKLKVSLQPNATPSVDSIAAKAVGFDGTKEKLQAYHNFVSFVLGHPIKTLTEIERLEGMMGMMEINFNKIVERLEKGEELSDKDRKNMFLVKDTLVDIHKLKYGEKKININADLKDIRDLMMQE